MQTNFLFFLLCFLFWESFKLWRSFLMMLFIIRPKHQLVFGVSRDWTSDLLFNHLRFYQLSKQIKLTQKKKKKNFLYYVSLIYHHHYQTSFMSYQTFLKSFWHLITRKIWLKNSCLISHECKKRTMLYSKAIWHILKRNHTLRN